jgi:peptidoglycan hydrolase CwlO-like protein
MRSVDLSAPVVALAIFVASVCQASAAQGGHQGRLFERVCAKSSNDGSRHDKIAARLAETLNLNDTQKAAYKAFQDERVKSIDGMKSKLCAKEPDLTSFEERLSFRQNVLEARLAAMQAENPKLIAFYNSLDDKQKGKFDSFRKRLKSE